MTDVPRSGAPQPGVPQPGPTPPSRRVSASRSLRLGPLLAVLAVFLVGLVVVAAGGWRPGLYVCAAALLLAALLRLVLPARAVGLLRVRHRAVDVLLLTGGAVAVGVVTYLR